nr:MAG TPA: hypothetical protein [Caudoviricetes sp.]
MRLDPKLPCYQLSINQEQEYNQSHYCHYFQKRILV